MSTERGTSPAVAAGSLEGKRAVVMGLGSFGGGVGAVRWLAAQGARVLVTDLRPPEELSGSLAALEGVPHRTVLGEHRPEDFDSAEIVVVNPAVRPDHPLLARARARGARITSEIELFLERVPARVLAVTGTQGKSSTIHMLGRLLDGAGLHVHVGGNLGGSLIERLAEIEPEDVCAIELSSYQLAALEDPAALTKNVVAVGITNVLLDHLERHGGEEGYLAAKLRILDLPCEGGAALVPAEDLRLYRPRLGLRIVRVFPPDSPGVPGPTDLYASDDDLLRGDEVLGRRSDVRLPGAFQVANALLALGLAREVGAEPEALARTLPTIGGLPHRFEPLGTFAGVGVIDNGVSTTPDSTVSALLSLSEPCTLLAGGRSKGLPLDELADEARERVRLLIAFGEAGPELAGALQGAGVPAVVVPTLDEAVALAFERTPENGTLLFSPACSSFDAFPNFAARADRFRDLLLERDGPGA